MGKKKKTKDGVNVRVYDDTHRILKAFTDKHDLVMTKFVDTAIRNEIKNRENGVQHNN